MWAQPAPHPQAYLRRRGREHLDIARQNVACPREPSTWCQRCRTEAVRLGCRGPPDDDRLTLAAQARTFFDLRPLSSTL
jgi:hypothetical protein